MKRHEKFIKILTESNEEERNKFIESLSEKDAKLLIKAIAKVLQTHSTENI